MLHFRALQHRNFRASLDIFLLKPSSGCQEIGNLGQVSRQHGFVGNTRDTQPQALVRLHAVSTSEKCGQNARADQAHEAESKQAGRASGGAPEAATSQDSPC